MSYVSSNPTGLPPEPSSAPEKHCVSCRCFAPKQKRRSGLKRDSQDVRWSKMVRERAGLRCQFIDVVNGHTAREGVLRCPAEVGHGLAAQGLHAAHCFTRGNPRTRLDPDNGLAMCAMHHAAIDASKSLRFFVFRYWLGEAKFDTLAAQAHQRRDR